MVAVGSRAVVLTIVVLVMLTGLPRVDAGGDEFRVCNRYQYENGIDGCGDPALWYIYRDTCEAAMLVGDAVGLLGASGVLSSDWTGCGPAEFMHLDVRWPMSKGTATFSLFQAKTADGPGELHYQVVCTVSGPAPSYIRFDDSRACTAAVHEPLDDALPLKRVEVAYSFDGCLPVDDDCSWWAEPAYLEWA